MASPNLLNSSIPGPLDQQMLSVLIIAPYHPKPAGVEVYATEVATRLVKAGIDVHVLSYFESKKANSEALYRLPTAPLPWIRGVTFVALASTMGSLLSALRSFDVVNAHYALTSGVAASLIKTSAPKVLTFHGSDVPPLKGHMRSLLPLFSSFASYVAVSNKLACELAKLGLPREKIKVIPGGVDFEKLSSVSRIPREEARKVVKLPVDRRIVLFMAPLVSYKNPLAVLVAFKLTSKRLQDACLVYCGRGPLIREVLRKAFELDIRSRVIFRPELPRSMVPYMLRAADVLVMPSLREAWGLVALEAMATCTPVIISKLAGIAEHLVNWHHAVLVDPYSQEELANAMKTLLNDPSLASYITTRATSIAKKFTWDLTVRRYLALFTSILGG